MRFTNFGMLHLWKNSRTNAPIPTVLGNVLFDYTWSLIRWRGVWPFHHRLLESPSVMLLSFLPWRDGASYSQATTTTSLSLSVLTFPSRIEDIRSFDVNMELSLSQRPFQEVTSGSSVPSSGPNGEGRAPELIDYPHPPLKSHRRYTTQERAKRSVLVPV